MFHNLNKVLFPLCSLLRKEYYTLGIDGVAVPARECVTSPHELCRVPVEHWRLNMDLGEAVRQPNAGFNVDHGLFKCPAFFICNRLQPELWRVRPIYRNSLKNAWCSSLDIPSDLLHSFPWGLSLPKEGASLLYSLHCRIVFLHSHAGPLDTSVSRTYGGLRKSCEYLPRGRPQGRCGKSKRSNIGEMECSCIEKDMPVLIICSLFNFLIISGI